MLLLFKSDTTIVAMIRIDRHLSPLSQRAKYQMIIVLSYFPAKRRK